MSLNLLDWIIIIIYLAGIITLSFFLARGQKNARDYYLGGNQTGPLPIAQLPLTDNGNINYNLAVPIFVLKHFPHGGKRRLE